MARTGGQNEPIFRGGAEKFRVVALVREDSR